MIRNYKENFSIHWHRGQRQWYQVVGSDLVRDTTRKCWLLCDQLHGTNTLEELIDEMVSYTFDKSLTKCFEMRFDKKFSKVAQQ